MSKERLEEIKDAIAHELGLTDDHMDGTYLYHLTRSKSAFAVGTMTLDDFKEIDEELLDEIFNAIEPFFIKQAERVQELEEDKNALGNLVKETAKIAWNIEQQNKRYREVINNINENAMLYGVDEQVYEAIKEAIKAVEGEE